MQAKDAFARREKFQLHFLLSHPSQPAPANGVSLAQSRAVFFDGKLQDADILSPRKDAGKQLEIGLDTPAHTRWQRMAHTIFNIGDANLA